ncbi:carboxypeptidase-like regulatory domain-containing protein [Planktosalinus lacus]|uniref:CarboxypepD_reg-like domain-containing protein n=1 Tax=Planktosalinus lacus TaxID=1526573 RepID=A0A8J2V8R1_9FLAO|nr:carboxypeptidase-like regulatory domain-containing protein [Planktosalinus lacus]GGD87913.1 hypothetical protein GCM10011312_09900 [Planktosalinus lacus]
MQKLLLVFLFVIPFVTFSQEIDRVLVQGKITAPPGEDLEGISIYNTSSQKGTISDAEGVFQIKVGLNDRVLFSALQFQKFTVIVDEGVLETQQMKIYVNPAVMQLDEVIVRPHDLTGNIHVDVSRIKTTDLALDLNLSWESMEFDYEFSADQSSAVENSALQEVQPAGLNILYPFALLADLLFKSDAKAERKGRMTTLEEMKLKDGSTIAIKQRFSERYFTETLKIKKTDIDNFLYFVNENGFTTELLREHNELKLMDFLEKQQKIYLSQSK